MQAENRQIEEAFPRDEPAVTPRTADFWAAGGEGVLRIARCGDCGRYQHPPLPVCPGCRGREVRPEAVSGEGTVWSYTLNRYPWAASMPVPYLVAEVELAEQAGLRLLTNLVECDVDSVQIGMRVSGVLRPGGRRVRPAVPAGGLSWSACEDPRW